jgi:serine/threonine protein kinase
VLGSGGFAAVYRCWQLRVGREVAVKVDNRVLLSERDRRRFVREVTAAGRLSGHPHVIDVYDAGTLPDGRPYLVMELCPAGSLADALHRDGPMSPAQVRDIGIRISDALAAAHAAGVLHRDIKPANILINRYGLVGLSDFGWRRSWPLEVSSPRAARRSPRPSPRRRPSGARNRPRRGTSTPWWRPCTPCSRGGRRASRPARKTLASRPSSRSMTSRSTTCPARRPG